MLPMRKSKNRFTVELQASGNYSHWGLTRAYGEVAAQQALAEAHRLLFLRLLRTPLRTLRDDVMVSSEALKDDCG